MPYIASQNTDGDYVNVFYADDDAAAQAVLDSLRVARPYEKHSFSEDYPSAANPQDESVPADPTVPGHNQ